MSKNICQCLNCVFDKLCLNTELRIVRRAHGSDELNRLKGSSFFACICSSTVKNSTVISDCVAALLFAYWVILHAFLLFVDIFQNQPFQKFISVIQSECQIVWHQIRPDILLGLIWVQLFAKVISRRHY